LAHGTNVNFDVSASGADLTTGMRTIKMLRSSFFFVRQAGGIAKASMA